MEDRETPNLPKDVLLAHLLHKFPHMVYKYHEHDSLLENKNEQDLSEEEKADAWKQYEDDVKRKNETNMGPYGNNFGMLPIIRVLVHTRIHCITTIVIYRVLAV